MKISPKVRSVLFWTVLILVGAVAAALVSVREVHTIEMEIQHNRECLERMGLRLDEMQKSLDRIEAELKEIELISGLASWYGPGFHGRTTASGSIYDQNGYTLAHRELPLGSWVAIKNESNGKVAFGIVNDRGPYVPGRDFDVSLALAKQLGFERKGLTQVTVRVFKIT